MRDSTQGLEKIHGPKKYPTRRIGHWRHLRLTAIAVLFLPLAAFAGGRFDGVVVFGDSLSDAGNFYALTGQQSLPPYLPIPTAPYALGGHHFSNGSTWAELLAVALALPQSAGPAIQGPSSFRNYAFGGARARPGGVAPDLSTQVGMYLGNVNGAVSAEGLFVIWFGANDVRDALAALAADTTGTTSSAIIGSALNAIASTIVELSLYGAREFLVLNVPDLSITPAVRAQGPIGEHTARQLSIDYNAGLSTTLDELEYWLHANRIDIVVHRLNVLDLLNTVAATPADFGLTNVTTPCLAFGVRAGSLCSEPNRHLFWDAIHPTAATHGILADAAVELLESP